jgi:hypothetical protein
MNIMHMLIVISWYSHMHDMNSYSTFSGFDLLPSNLLVCSWYSYDYLDVSDMLLDHVYVFSR